MRHHHTPVIMAKFKTLTLNAGKDVKSRSAHSLLVETHSSGTAPLEGSLAVSYKTKHTHTIWSSSHIAWYLLNYTENLSIHTHTHTHTQTSTWMFIATLLITAKSWKQLNYSSIGECINKFWYPYSEMLFSAIKKCIIKLWKDMEESWMRIAERSQSGRAMYYMILTIWHSGKGKTMERVNRSVVVKGSRRGWED